MADERTPVVFVHGLWLHSTSWGPWVDLFREAGYEPVAPEWPGTPDTVEAARANPASAAGYGITAIADHYADLIATLPTRPIVVGHSFGGLIVQNLLGRGVAAAGVAIDAAPIKGVLFLPLSALRVASIALRNPANYKGTVALTRDQFRYGFGNQLSAKESEELFEKWTIPSPGKPLFEAATANFTMNSPAKVDTTNATRGPLLLIAGGKDHTVPESVVRSAHKLYHRSPAVSEFKEFPDRGHSLVLDHGWREIADYALSWLRAKSMV
jgi:pimeloyl-ACP methyl ester carboxylesterase